MTPTTTRSGSGSAATRALVFALVVTVATAPLVAAAPTSGGLGAVGAATAHGGVAADAASAATEQAVFCGLTASEIAPGESVTVEVDPTSDVDDLQYDKYGDGNFGDFTEETSRTFTYEEPGTYTPQVKAWSYPSENSSVEVCGNLTVTAPFDVELVHEPESPEVGQTVSFAADVAGDPEGSVQYAWDFTGDDEFERSSAEPVVEHTYDEPGEYTVRVRVTDDAGRSVTVERTVAVGQSSLDVELAFDPASPRVGEPVGFQADVAGDSEGAVEYAWDLDGDDEFERSSAEPVVEHTYDEPGEYPVRVRVTDGAGRTGRAERTLTVRETESTATPTPTATPAAGEVTAEWWYTPLTPRTGEVVTLIAEGGGLEGATFEWDLDGDGSVDTTGPTVSHTFGEAGDHEVTLRVSTAGDRVTDTQTVSVEPYPAAGGGIEGPSFWYTPLDPRVGEMVVLVASPEDPDAVEQFAWDLDGDGGVDQRGPVATYVFEDNGSTGVTLDIHRSDGSVETVGNNVTVELSANETIREATVEEDDDALLDRLRERVEEIPGFGTPATVAALVVAAVLAARRRRSGG